MASKALPELVGPRGPVPDIITATYRTRSARLQIDLDVAQRQLCGFTRAIRFNGHVVAHEVVPPAEGAIRTDLLSEIGRIEAQLAMIDLPVVPMTDAAIPHDSPSDDAGEPPVLQHVRLIQQRY